MERKCFDAYMNEQFKKYCPDAARFLNSLNPIARKRAEEDRFSFTMGMIVRHNLDENDLIEWDLAVAGDVCPHCDQYNQDEQCEEDPARCELFEALDAKLFPPTNTHEKEEPRDER